MPVRAAAGAALLSLVVGLNASAAFAQTYGSDNQGVWNKFMKSVGVNAAPDPNSDINYTERPPLVVPPSRDLPPPVADPADTERELADERRQTGQAREIQGRAYSGDCGAEPRIRLTRKKPWYNPAGWFSKEEYGTFAGEPVRQDLTEPPAGYRVPSPEQPYGISPEKKPHRGDC